MKKSIKKFVASFLAVLMIVFAMPFTALADHTTGPDKYPNWDLIFNAFTFKNTYFNYTETAANLNNRGIKEAPLLYDATAKTLTGKKTFADNAGLSSTTGTSASTKRYKKTGDYQLQEGDYFYLTIALENVASLWGAGLELQFTGCEPQGLYTASYYDEDEEDDVAFLSFGEDDPRVQAAIDNGADVSLEEWAAAGTPIASLSAGSTFYGSSSVMKNFDVTASTNESWGIAFGFTTSNDNDNISSLPSPAQGTNSFKCPEDGTANYDYSYRAPMGTYLFKVTDADDIAFDLHNEESYLAYDFNAQGKADQVTYYETEYPGSAGMDFMGSNVHRGAPPVVTYPTVTITTPAGYQDLSYTADASTTTYPVPNLADYTKASDSDYHYTAQWKDNSVPTGTFGAADESFEIEFASAAHTYGEPVIDPAPTCTTAGTATYTCSVCGHSYTESVTDTNAHNWGAWAADDATWAATTDQTVEANNSATVTFKRTCANDASHVQTQNVNATVSSFTAAQEGVAGSVTFSATYEGVTATKTYELEALAHTHNYNTLQEIPNTRVAATCSSYATYQTAMYCSCGEYDQSTVDTVTDTAAGYDYANHVNLVNVAAQAATCTADGVKAHQYCDACGKYYINNAEVQAADTVDPQTGHDFTGAIDVSWAETNQTGAGKWVASAVQHCKNDASHTTDVAVTTAYSHKDATNKEAGYDKWEAKLGDEVLDAKTEVIAAAGVNITIAATDLGTVEGTIPTNGSEVTQTLPFGTKYTVTAVRPAGTTFLGWQLNGKLVSTTDTYSSVAYTDITLVPVFQETADDNINVFFYDKYGNTIKAFKDVTVAAYQAAVAEGVPAAPTYPGYTFTGYDKSDDDIKATSTSATFTAQYEKADTTFTVNAPGATIQVSEGTVDGETATVPYDAQVTVKAAGAAGWAIDGVTVAYGDEYTFYVGADVTVTPVADAEVAPIVNIINVTNNAPNYTVLATRAAGNATITQRGWMYGRSASNEALADLEAAQADAGVRVKIAAANDGANEFALTFKASNAGTIRVRAFIVDSRGNIYYSAIEDVNV